MYKFGFIFSQWYFSFPVYGANWIKQKKDKDITHLFSSNLNLYIGINVTYKFTAKKFTQKIVWNTKHKLMQIVIHTGPAHSPHSHFLQEKHCIQRSLSRYRITSTW